MTRAIHSAPTLLTVSAAATVAALLVAGATGAAAQTRWNKTIEVIEAGGAAVANEHWRFIDMEHAPFSAERLYAILTEMDENRDADGRMSLTPLVRIPQDGDEDFKWAVKQVLDMGAFGVILPHVDTGEEAVRLVRAMRYPPTRDSAIPEPRGERGWGPGRATRIWGAADAAEYHGKADVWPLNPEGELFAVAMIESAEAVSNIQDILAAPVSAIFVVPGDMSIDSASVRGGRRTTRRSTRPSKPCWRRAARRTAWSVAAGTRAAACRNGWTKGGSSSCRSAASGPRRPALRPGRRVPGTRGLGGLRGGRTAAGGRRRGRRAVRRWRGGRPVRQRQ